MEEESDCQSCTSCICDFESGQTVYECGLSNDKYIGRTLSFGTPKWCPKKPENKLIENK